MEYVRGATLAARIRQIEQDVLRFSFSSKGGRAQAVLDCARKVGTAGVATPWVRCGGSASIGTQFEMRADSNSQRREPRRTLD